MKIAVNTNLQESEKETSGKRVNDELDIWRWIDKGEVDAVADDDEHHEQLKPLIAHTERHT